MSLLLIKEDIYLSIYLLGNAQSHRPCTFYHTKKLLSKLATILHLTWLFLTITNHSGLLILRVHFVVRLPCLHGAHVKTDLPELEQFQHYTIISITIFNDFLSSHQSGRPKLVICFEELSRTKNKPNKSLVDLIQIFFDTNLIQILIQIDASDQDGISEMPIFRRMYVNILFTCHNLWIVYVIVSIFPSFTDNDYNTNMIAHQRFNDQTDEKQIK